jgi:DNA-binding NarL/FixJ family response regulator
MEILIVDDNAMIRRGLKLLLSDYPTYTVCGEAGDGEEAIVKAKELKPDFILLDISMPGASGFEVAVRLRREIPRARIIIMSQHDKTTLLPRALESGADACIDKDALSAELLITIQGLTENADAPGPTNIE